ncbi:MAG: acyltransferase family protein [Dokdonella sp.]
METGERYAGLDALRVVAGVALLVAHGAFWLAPFGLPDALWLAIGHLGVDGFLVVTGFLCGLHFFSSVEISALRFWARRALRLLPLYFLFIAINLVLAPHLGVSTSAWPAYFTLNQNLAWPHPQFFAEMWIVPAVVAFYLLLPIVWRWLLRRGQASVVAGTLGLIGLIAVANLIRFLFVAHADAGWDEGVRKVVIARLDAPLYGVLLAWLVARNGFASAAARNSTAVVGALMLLTGIAIHLLRPIDTDSQFVRTALFTWVDLGWAALLPWACAGHFAPRVAGLLTLLAASAYPLLLSHMTLLRVAAVAGLPLTTTSQWHGIVLLGGYVIVALTIGLGICFAIDRPLLIWRARLLPTQMEHLAPFAKR